VSSVKTKLNPTKVKKRPLDTMNAVGRKNGMTVRYDKAKEINMANPIACTHKDILVNSSRIKSPPCSKRTKDDQISGGRGNISEEVYQANKANMTCTTMMMAMVGRDTVVLGLKMRKNSWVMADMEDEVFMSVV